MEESTKAIITSENFDQYQQDAIKTIASYVQKQRLALPRGEVKFYRTVDPALAGTLDVLSRRIKTKLNQLIANVDLPGCEQLGGVTDAKEVDVWYKEIIALNDSLLDGANISLDEFTGRSQKFAASSATQLAPTIGKVKAKSGPVNVVYSRVIGRPQIKFKDKIDNSGAPFIPKLPNKPNEIVPLKVKSGSHPYQHEIMNIKYPSFMFEMKPPIMYPPIETTSLTWVDTLEELSAMCKKLEVSQEFAVDLEHHDYRSYQGFTCLMQISTRDEDFIVDTLELRNSLHVLNNFFTNPNVVKVFHGADYDIQWLQKDFGVYVVNLFDTGVASHLLGLPQHSLAYLLKYYCDVETDKKYQLADWRLRPLTEEMILYARTDTHYLLYIYDRMRNDLILKSDTVTLNRLQVTLDRSAEVSLRVYETFGYDKTGKGPGGYQKLLGKWGTSLDKQQLSVFKALHEWRDSTARLEDESIGYVLPNDMLILLSEQMPDDPKEIGKCLRGYVPPLVREHALELVMLIAEAKEKATSSSDQISPSQSKMVVRKMEGVELITESKDVKWVLDSSGPINHADLIRAKDSILFGNSLNKSATSNEVSWNKAAEIYSSLTFSLPILPKTITPALEADIKTELVVEQSHEEILYVPAEERSTKSKGKQREIVDLSKSSKKRQRQDDDEDAEANDMDVKSDNTEHKKEILIKDVDTVMQEESSSRSSVGHVESVLENKGLSGKRQRKKKKDKYSSKINEEVSDIVDHTQLPSSLMSVISTSESSTSRTEKSKSETKRSSTIIASTSTTHKEQPFNPYGKIIDDEKFQKKDPRLPTAPSSGNRSTSINK
ncbi:10908_t:CDS:10 [Acaulospora morrowiae]|uniref:10908_t:CDS:1 n=1 Tax=Acaulospora morrowiae TaxID=94023 RepID=A0A9N8WN04_9GLOM|nr:10908_t:CDS:10 [Acaulospora morrowiae]